MRLELGRRGAYAVRVAVHLATNHGQGRQKARDIAENTGVPRAYLAHILTMLVDAGIVESQAGPNGGYALAVEPDDVSLLNVLTAAEGAMEPTECVLRDTACRADGTTCAVHDTWFRGHEALRHQLAGASLATLADPGGART